MKTYEQMFSIDVVTEAKVPSKVNANAKKMHKAIRGSMNSIAALSKSLPVGKEFQKAWNDLKELHEMQEDILNKSIELVQKHL